MSMERRRLWAVQGNGGQDQAGTDVTAAQQPVEQPAPAAPLEGTVVAHRDELRPIVPAWMRTAEGRRKTVRWWVRRRVHLLGLHAFWSPAYLLRVLTRSPRGLYRAVVRLGAWALDTRADAMEQELASAGRSGVVDYLKLREDRTSRVRARLLVLGLVVVLGGAGTGAAWWFGGTWAHVGLLVALVLVLARVGTDPEKPLVEQQLITGGPLRELTPAIVMRALKAAGLGGTAAKVSKSGEVVEEDTRPGLLQPIMRAENGTGWLAHVALPYGKTVEDAAGAVEQLASGLDVEQEQVFVEQLKGSTRRIALYVADEDPFTLPARPSPLAKAPQVSVWDAHPLGVEPRGRELRPSLLFNSFLIGAIPRSGKTFAARALVAPCLLDPFCDLTWLDFKGGRDWLPAAPLAVACNAGDDEEDLLYGLAVLERLKTQMQGRFKAFRKMTDEECPEGKLTRDMARDGLRPHLLVIDEVQNLLRAMSKDVRRDALALLVWLAKTAPAAGLTLVMATQRPAADVVPADLRDNTSVRLALRTKTWQSSDAILGQGIGATGFSTHRFLEEHKGAAILGGVSNGRGGDLSRIRVDLLTGADFTRLCQVGLQRRRDAGTLTGQAAGETDEVRITVTIVADVLAVWPQGAEKAHGAELLQRLQQLRPELYGPLDQTALTKALQAAGVPVGQVKVAGVNRNGYELTALQKAAAAALPPAPEPVDE